MGGQSASVLHHPLTTPSPPPPPTSTHPQAILNVFREDPQYEEHEQQYKAILREILGDDEDDDDNDGSGRDGSGDGGSEDYGSDDGAPGGGGMQQAGGQQDIQDETGTDLVNLRRTIYLTIMSSLDFEEAGHKLMKIALAPGQVCGVACRHMGHIT